MVFIKWNKEKVETEGERIKSSKELEKRLEKLGWTNLRWCPSNPLRDSEHRWELHGLPPNYEGPYEDHQEAVIITLATPGKSFQDSGEILIRDILHRPIDYEKDSIY